MKGEHLIESLKSDMLRDRQSFQAQIEQLEQRFNCERQREMNGAFEHAQLK